MKQFIFGFQVIIILLLSFPIAHAAASTTTTKAPEPSQYRTDFKDLKLSISATFFYKELRKVYSTLEDNYLRKIPYEELIDTLKELVTEASRSYKTFWQYISINADDVTVKQILKNLFEGLENPDQRVKLSYINWISFANPKFLIDADIYENLHSKSVLFVQEGVKSYQNMENNYGDLKLSFWYLKLRHYGESDFLEYAHENHNEEFEKLAKYALRFRLIVAFNQKNYHIIDQLKPDAFSVMIESIYGEPDRQVPFLNKSSFDRRHQLILSNGLLYNPYLYVRKWCGYLLQVMLTLPQFTDKDKSLIRETLSVAHKKGLLESKTEKVETEVPMPLYDPLLKRD